MGCWVHWIWGVRGCRNGGRGDGGVGIELQEVWDAVSFKTLLANIPDMVLGAIRIVGAKTLKVFNHLCVCVCVYVCVCVCLFLMCLVSFHVFRLTCGGNQENILCLVFFLMPYRTSL